MNAKYLILIASIAGAIFGVLYTMAWHPGYDYTYWIGLSVIAGVGVGNLALLVIVKTFELFKEL